mgnify:CR=1 FL=1
MNPKLIILSVALATVAYGAKMSDNDKRGLQSIKPFCDGKGRLDDFRDVVQDVYLQRSGRGMTVSA